MIAAFSPDVNYTVQGQRWPRHPVDQIPARSYQPTLVINYAILHAMQSYIAVDVGGTRMRAACFPASQLQPATINKIETQTSEQGPLERVQSLIHSVWPADGEVLGIGIAAPGPVNPFAGMIFEAPNIPSFTDLPLQDILQELFEVPVALGNDANLAALGEWKHGAGQGHHHLIYLTISTGVGGGVIVDDRLLLGAQGLAAELGHVTILPDGPVCSCGKRGHLEALASGTAIARYAEQELAAGRASKLPSGQKLTTRQIAEAAAQGDAFARQALARAGEYIGMALANYVHIFNPTIIVIGGGVSQAGDLLMRPMRAALEEHIFDSPYLEDLHLTTASLGDESGLFGALAYIQMAISTQPSLLSKTAS